MPPYSQANAREHAINSFGTYMIFDRRAKSLAKRLRFLDYVGLAVPFLIGGLVMSGIEIPGGWVTAAGVLLVIQGLVFLLAIVFGWQDQHSYACEARRENREIAELYDQAVTNPPSQGDWDRLVDRRQHQDGSDDKYAASQEERRFGMRHALYQYKHQCATCKVTPESMSPSNCATCGNFSTHWVN